MNKRMLLWFLRLLLLLLQSLRHGLLGKLVQICLLAFDLLLLTLIWERCARCYIWVLLVLIRLVSALLAAFNALRQVRLVLFTMIALGAVLSAVLTTCRYLIGVLSALLAARHYVRMLRLPLDIPLLALPFWVHHVEMVLVLHLALLLLTLLRPALLLSALLCLEFLLVLLLWAELLLVVVLRLFHVSRLFFLLLLLLLLLLHLSLLLLLLLLMLILLLALIGLDKFRLPNSRLRLRKDNRLHGLLELLQLENAIIASQNPEHLELIVRRQVGKAPLINQTVEHMMRLLEVNPLVAVSVEPREHSL
jgi:hypothetical protein